MQQKTWVAVVACVCIAVVAVLLSISGRSAQADEPKKDPAKNEAGEENPGLQKGDAPKADNQGVQGTWKVVTFEESTREMPAEAVKQFRVTITEKTFRMATPDWKAIEGTYQLDAGKKPKWFDLTDVTITKPPPDKAKSTRKVLKGIYELDGDTLKIVLRQAEGGERPKDFAGGQGLAVLILKRDKEAKKGQEKENGQGAAELPDAQGIKRAAPAKEPDYQSNSPLYCLLVAGLNAEQRFWLVLDGKTLYVDRQGNGDLTKGLKLRPRQDIVFTDGSEQFVLGALPATGAKPQFSNLLFSFKPAADNKGVSFRIGTDDPRFLPESRPGPISVPLAAGLLSKRPQEAPVIWLDGPRHMILETSAETTLVPGKELQLYVSVGTYLSKESGRKLLYWEVPAGVHPTVEIEFPAKKGAPPIKSRFTLKERC